MNLKGLENPYEKLEDDQVVRLQADISVEDYALIRAVIPFRGVLQSTVNILVHSICNELRESGIKHYDPDNLATYISIVQRRANTRLAGQTADGDVRIRVKGIHNTPSLIASAATSVEKRTDDGVGERKIKRRKGVKGDVDDRQAVG